MPVLECVVLNRKTYLYCLSALLLFALHSVCHALTLVEGATILTMAEADKDAFIGYLLIDDEGQIRQVAEGTYEGSTVDTKINASGKIIIPGFVSGHSHLWQSAFRGISANTETWPWLHAMPWKYGDHFAEGDFYNFTLHGALDQLAHGITTTYNHSQRLEATEEHYLESLTASLDSGQRFVFAYKSDLSLSNSGIRKNIVGMVERYRTYAGPGNMLALSLNVSVFRPTPAQLRLQVELAREYGLTIQHTTWRSTPVAPRNIYCGLVSLRPGQWRTIFLMLTSSILRTSFLRILPNVVPL